MRWRDRCGVLWEVTGFWNAWGERWGYVELQQAGRTGNGSYRCEHCLTVFGCWQPSSEAPSTP